MLLRREQTTVDKHITPMKEYIWRNVTLTAMFKQTFTGDLIIVNQLYFA